MGNEFHTRRNYQSIKRSINNMDKTELLYDHYKETFSIIKETIIQRNRFFIMVFFVITLQFLFATSPESISSMIIGIVQNQYEIDISNQMSIIQSFLWLILLYLTMRYYQATVYIERQYNCIYSIEADISSIEHIRFDRESGNYLSNYPKMSDFVDALYKWVFPIIYCMIICYKIVREYMTSKFNMLLVLNTILAISCFILTILYLVFLHGKHNSNSSGNS